MSRGLTHNYVCACLQGVFSMCLRTCVSVWRAHSTLCVCLENALVIMCVCVCVPGRCVQHAVYVYLEDVFIYIVCVSAGCAEYDVCLGVGDALIIMRVWRVRSGWCVSGWRTHHYVWVQGVLSMRCIWRTAQHSVCVWRVRSTYLCVCMEGTLSMICVLGGRIQHDVYKCLEGSLDMKSVCVSVASGRRGRPR